MENVTREELERAVRACNSNITVEYLKDKSIESLLRLMHPVERNKYKRRLGLINEGEEKYEIDET